MSGGRRLTRSFFSAPTVEVARRLVGCCLVRRCAKGVVAGRIVETEAYLSEGDSASHSHRGESARNRSMFGRPGTAYVYLIYGVHHCLNVVTAQQGVGEAVLLRALEPLEGLELMSTRRRGRPERELCDGPGKLVQAFGLGLGHDGLDLCRGELGIWAPEHFGAWDASTTELTAGPRVGISKAAELPLRFTLAGSPWLSRA